jgi:hypothetical protein
MSSQSNSGIYGLTKPIVQPEHEITSVYDKPSMHNLSPEEQFALKQTTKNRTNGFGETFNVK